MKKLILILAVLAFLIPAVNTSAQISQLTYKFGPVVSTSLARVCCSCQITAGVFDNENIACTDMWVGAPNFDTLIHPAGREESVIYMCDQFGLAYCASLTY